MFKSFIEAQFPVSRVSKESYKERSAKDSQTLTGLGKWWGRKPLILVRAAIVGLLMPASNDPKRDRDVFLKILTMDDAGLLKRRDSNFTMKDLWARATPGERAEVFDPESVAGKAKYRKKISAAEKDEIQRQVFARLSYDMKLESCARPEEIDGPSEAAWKDINAHLKTSARNLPELVKQLGEKQFGHVPRVGDAFSGGGSIPFEAARIGCDAFGSDLNPVAALLTWAALNIVGGGPEMAEKVRAAQKKVYDLADKQITEWGIEHNEKGRRADAYLYCTEAKCPECGWMVPLASSWVVSERYNGIAILKARADTKSFDIKIICGVSDKELFDADRSATVKDSYMRCPNHPNVKTPINALRGENLSDEKGTFGRLRLWNDSDVSPKSTDAFQERLYCIRFTGNGSSERYFAAPGEEDLIREAKTCSLLQERLCDWQQKGYLPSRRIEYGDKTDEPIRTKGWSYWHHLFTPRQLLTVGLLNKVSSELEVPPAIKAAVRLGISRSADYNSRLSRWHTRKVGDKSEQVFSNQALNTLFDYAARSLISLEPAFMLSLKSEMANGSKFVETKDARNVAESCEFWITDPPYADAINYHELSEFFLAWHEKSLPRLFPNWYTDSKRALAIRGKDESFRRAMVDCYKNLAEHMPDNGAQIVMFTHQDASVWADLALILWASGLHVTAAWCIATETDSALKDGNYVQGTVLLVLRKLTGHATAFLTDLQPEIETEVRKQLDSMMALEDKDDPNFADTDYQLAAYAAALRVLTQYKSIGDMDVIRELNRERKKGAEPSPLEKIITDAVKVACDHLVPSGFDTQIWKRLATEERFYLKGLDLESHAEHRIGAYQELARGFGLKEYKPLMQTGKANQTRLKTATEFGNKELATYGSGGFNATLLRHILFAIREAVKADDAQEGKRYLRAELPDYWNRRTILVEVLQYLSRRMGEHWTKDAGMATILAGAVEHDHA